MVVKTEKGPIKPIIKRKFSGFSKQRFYCNICQKQCRDYNGFKCHLLSDSHQRQLLIGLQMIAEFNARNSEDM